MDRRQFTSALAGALLPAPYLLQRVLADASAPRINGTRLNAHLREMSAFGSNPQGGVSRVAFSEADREGRAYAMQLMRDAGLEVHVDVAANIFGRRPGADSSLKPIVFGSHIDSVPEGGNYDGTVGSLSAIEIAQSFSEQGVRTRHPLEVVIWADEEGGLVGSRAVSGQLEERELATKTWSGKTIGDGVAFLGGDPARLGQARRKPGDIATYLELHIEQGGNLERESLQIGVVEGIVGIRQWAVTIEGFANHAGTTPMDQRRDAMLSAARFTATVNRIVRAEPGRQVGTVGKMQAFPGAANVIPGRVECTLELRDLDDAKIARLFETISKEAHAMGQADGTTFAFKSLHENISAKCDPAVKAMITQASEKLRYTLRPMPSGAGHDAQAMSVLGPMGMIFIPSIGGISHSPREFSRPDDIVRGAEVLMEAVLLADAR